MSLPEPFTPEGIDPNSSYLATCINRVNTNYKAAIAGITGALDPVKVASLISDVASLKLGQVIINVKDYGAVGNDTAIDTTAIQNAVNAVSTSNGVLYFPNGTYRINGKITIANKTNLLVMSDSARIRHTTGVDTLSFESCNNVKFSGNLYIFTQTSGLTCQAVVINNCPFCNFSNLHIGGDFLYGIHVFYHARPSCSITATIFGCRTGIHVARAGEYVQIINSVIYNCGTGINCLGPNVHISSCEITDNIIGITIEGDAGAGANTDHCGIVACAINHNQACGIFAKNLTLSLNITGNNIWATIGPAAFTYAAATAARVGCFGVYIENSPNVNITGNLIARCNQLIGCDGWNNCSICNNHLLSDETKTSIFIGEFGNTNSRVSNVNFNNIITNNIFDRALTSAFKRILFHNNTTSYGYVMKNNRGTVNSNLYNNLLIQSNGTYEIGQEENVCINSALGSVNATTNDAAGRDSQVLSVTVLPVLQGCKFTITFFNMYNGGGNKWIWIRFKQSDNSTVLWTNGNGFSQHIPALKAIQINTLINQQITFIPYGIDANQWIVQGINS